MHAGELHQAANCLQLLSLTYIQTCHLRVNKFPHTQTNFKVFLLKMYMLHIDTLPFKNTLAVDYFLLYFIGKH